MKILPVVVMIACLGLARAYAQGRPGGGPPAAVTNVAAGLADEFGRQTATNNWKGARAAFDRIDWRTVDEPLAVLRELSAALRRDQNAVARGLRREVNTKYWLLKAPDDPELADKAPRVPVPVVAPAVVAPPRVEGPQVRLATIVIDVPDLRGPGVRFVGYVVDVPAVRAGGLRFAGLAILELRPDVLRALGVNVPVVAGRPVEVVFLRVTNETFLSAVSRWEQRYSRRLDFWDDRGARVVPMHGTVLWELRRRVIEQVAAGGDYGELWGEYDRAFRRAAQRRQGLGRRAR